MNTKQLYTVAPRRPRDTRTRRRVRTARAANPYMDGTVPVPFRWDVARKVNLGTLLEGDTAATCANFMSSLLDCAARVVAAAGNADLVFVGRSPESLYDILSGLLRDSTWHERLTLLQFSVGYTERSEACRKDPEALAAFRTYLNSMRLSPAKIIVRERPVAFVDLLCNGNTFDQFLTLLYTWAMEEKADWPAVKRKLRVVGIVRAREAPLVPKWKKRCKPWRWRDDAPWMNDLLERGALREVVIDESLWSYLGDRQDKTTRSYVPEHWGDPSYALPYREGKHCLRAVRLARGLFEEGQKLARRQDLSKLLSRTDAMKYGWLRNLVMQLRGRYGETSPRD